jgi:hypothetical protein
MSCNHLEFRTMDKVQASGVCEYIRRVYNRNPVERPSLVVLSDATAPNWQALHQQANSNRVMFILLKRARCLPPDAASSTQFRARVPLTYGKSISVVTVEKVSN